MLALHAVALAAAMASAHTVITYPGWRGNNLHTNGTNPTDCPDCLGIDYYDNGTSYFPYGMQWMYPCKQSRTPKQKTSPTRLPNTMFAGGGLPQASNRTYWPVSGGALALQPGWFPGHSKAFIYINIGIQEEGQLAPLNYSHIVVPGFEITGPSDEEYGGQFCLPQISMPANVSLQVGQNITIQVVEQAQHGAALYSVSAPW